MNQIAERIDRSQRRGFWAIEIRGAGLGHRYLCRARSERDASDQVGRLMGAMPGATGSDMYWIDAAQLSAGAGVLPILGANHAVWDTGRCTALIAAHTASERAAADRRPIAH